jgi:tetratricopeptide (TPR) repeat protein
MSESAEKEGGGGEWVLIGMDEKLARRQGVPAKVPVPRVEFEGLAEHGLSLDKARKWISQFLSTAPHPKDSGWKTENAALLKAYEAFIGKTELWQKAQAAFAKDDFKAAMSSLRLITSVDPDDHAARLNLASAFANMGDHANALKHFEAVRVTFGGDADFHTSLGHLFMATGEREKAAEEMSLALEANPACKPAMDALVKLGVLIPVYEDPKDAASLAYLRADRVREYLVGEWDGPLAEGAKARNADFYLQQLAYHEAERRPDVALAAADRALAAAGATDAEKSRARMGRIAALRATGKNADAKKEVLSEIESHPNTAWAHVELSRCLMDEGAREEGRKEIDRALELDPGDQTALLLRFWPGDPSMENVQAAIPALAAFAEAHADAAGAWRSLARAKVAVGSDDEARTTYARAVKLAPNDDELRAEYWAELNRQKKFDEVLSDAATVEGLTKRDWKLRWNEAEAYKKAGKKVEARAAFAAINFDESLHVDVRKRAKRAVTALDGSA